MSADQACECGSTTGPFVEDLSGALLCPTCAADSTVRCTICGDDAPVRLYDEGGAIDREALVGVPNYFAACRVCDHATTEVSR